MPRGDRRHSWRGTLFQRLQRHLESDAGLGFDVGEGRKIIDFLARLEMGDIEYLIGDGFSGAEREQLLSMVEERKGQLESHELPSLEAAQRAELLEWTRRRAQQRTSGSRRQSQS
jgi:hypothetical protein